MNISDVKIVFQSALILITLSLFSCEGPKTSIDLNQISVDWKFVPFHEVQYAKQKDTQLIDDVNGVTLASAYSKDVSGEGTKSEVSKRVGTLIGERAKALGIDSHIELDTPVDRPMKLSEGTPIDSLFV